MLKTFLEIEMVDSVWDSKIRIFQKTKLDQNLFQLLENISV